MLIIQTECGPKTFASWYMTNKSDVPSKFWLPVKTLAKRNMIFNSKNISSVTASEKHDVQPAWSKLCSTLHGDTVVLTDGFNRRTIKSRSPGTVFPV
jgi:hypothetical protein